MKAASHEFDVAVIGAGPVGLCFAAAMARAQFKVALIEKQPESSLAEPACDGREIALTHRSMQTMQTLGVWSAIAPEEIAPLKAAMVLNAASHYQLQFDPGHAGVDALGYLVPNHLIRKAAYQCMVNEPGVTLFAERELADISMGADTVTLRMTDGMVLRSKLLVAADSRYSSTRRAMGIAADMLDFGKTMLVCRMNHEHAHEQTAWEWFGEQQTLALLPLPGDCSSIVITVPAAEAQRLQQLDEDAFNRDIERRFAGRLGRMQLQGRRHAYPLVATYARRFTAQRFALLGDAAVGMHPVTAHGFNLGLRGMDTLVSAISHAARAGQDIASDRVLTRYALTHRRDTWPLYMATNAIVRLYTDNRPLARMGRHVALRLANRIQPFKKSLLSMLTEARSGFG
ncbi:MAG: 5-demethoxyubiquinol-8 5-hydroxylase UbiM [Steroidobacteraceae bacterium]